MLPSRNEMEASVLRAFSPLVFRLARDFSGRGVEFEDLVQDGSLALLEAIRSYDPDRCAAERFPVHAESCIRRALYKSLGRRFLIRLPAHVMSNLRRLQSARQALHSEGIDYPSPQEIAERAGFTPLVAARLQAVPCVQPLPAAV